MSFAYPFVLWLWVPLALFAWLFRPRRMTHVADIAVMFLLIGALAHPIKSDAPRSETVRGKTVIFALDASQSMLARDVSPSRYDFAKETIHAFLNKNPADAVGLIAFTTNPLLLAPPTTDHTLVHRALEALDLRNILTKGTSLRRLLKFIGTLEEDEATVVLMSDGGEERNAEALAQLLPPSVTPVILPLATRAGAPIPLENGMLNDKKGDLVISRRNPTLSEFAALTDAAWLEPSPSPEETADKLRNLLDKAASHSLHRDTQGAVSMARLFLIPALMLLFLAHTRFARYLLVAAALAHLPLEAGMLDAWQLRQAYKAYASGDINASLRLLGTIRTSSLQRAYLRAALLYKQGAYTKAARAFLAVKSTSPRLKQRLLYNAATAYAKAGRYATARRLYARALQLGDDADTRHNLAVIALKRPAKAPVSRTKPGGAQSGANSDDTDKSDTLRKRNKKRSQQSGGGGDGRTKASTASREKPLPATSRPMPLSSKVYDLINKGYIRETKPW